LECDVGSLGLFLLIFGEPDGDDAGIEDRQDGVEAWTANPILIPIAGRVVSERCLGDESRRASLTVAMAILRS